MSVTLNYDAELPLDKHDCAEYIDHSPRYVESNAKLLGQRIGQYWFNCLGVLDQNMLVGTLYDPFNRDDWLSVIRALQFLLEN